MSKFYAVFYEEPKVDNSIISNCSALYGISSIKENAIGMGHVAINLNNSVNPSVYIAEGQFLEDLGDLISCAFNGNSFSGARFAVNRLDKISQTNLLS